VISYNGTGFHGWQNQKDGNSVQEVIEQTLSNILKTPMIIYGCGRTDAGVHADNYIFHATIPEGHSTLKYRLNKQLPDQIAVKTIVAVPENAHAQKDAIERIYTYYIHQDKNPSLNTFSTWDPDVKIDMELINSACALIENTSDFKSFCLSPNKHYSTICKIHKVETFHDQTTRRLAIRFHGDHYLKSMIRLLVGELIRVSEGKTSLENFETYLQNTAEKPRHHKAHPQGLHLSYVQYPYLKTEIKKPF
jgi:tRNA pseudouridine38-40 synthase